MAKRPNAAARRQRRQPLSVAFRASDGATRTTATRRSAKTCQAAVGRLPAKQGEIIDGLFFAELDPAELARLRGVARSTVYNHKRQAILNLERDELFFSALRALGKVRDVAREREIERRYPDGRLPDGRRIVSIAP